MVGVALSIYTFHFNVHNDLYYSSNLCNTVLLKGMLKSVWLHKNNQWTPCNYITNYILVTVEWTFVAKFLTSDAMLFFKFSTIHSDSACIRIQISRGLNISQTYVICNHILHRTHVSDCINKKELHVQVYIIYTTNFMDSSQCEVVDCIAFYPAGILFYNTKCALIL